MEKKYAILPADDAVQNWFEENIDKECSASSAIYKFRQWLESLQREFQAKRQQAIGLGLIEEEQPGALWVKASERLPGWKKRVKWRDGNNHSYATDGEISLFEMEKPNLEGWEWLDESPATFNPELFRIISDAEQSKEDDLKAVKEVISGAAGREEDKTYFDN